MVAASIDILQLCRLRSWDMDRLEHSTHAATACEGGGQRSPGMLLFRDEV
jgi:hypothetical protein